MEIIVSGKARMKTTTNLKMKIYYGYRIELVEAVALSILRHFETSGEAILQLFVHCVIDMYSYRRSTSESVQYGTIYRKDTSRVPIAYPRSN